LPGYVPAALVVLFAAEILLFTKWSVARDYFYLLAWWPYIVIADGLHFKLRGWSLLESRFRAFLALLPWSVTVWLIFELINLRLGNWHYIGIVSHPIIRWTCYTLSFATVFPAIFVTYLLIRATGIFKGVTAPKFEVTATVENLMIFMGVSSLVLPLMWPRYFYPLIWGSFVLILDPFNKRSGAPSLLGDLSQGKPQKALQLMLSGLICGLLWEFWNFWAGSKWIYTIPFIEGPKLFEMVLPGFLGFPPFALECYVIYVFIQRLNLAPGWDLEGDEAGRTGEFRPWQIFVHLLFWLFCYFLIDNNTVMSFH